MADTKLSVYALAMITREGIGWGTKVNRELEMRFWSDRTLHIWGPRGQRRIKKGGGIFVKRARSKRRVDKKQVQLLIGKTKTWSIRKIGYLC